MSWRGGIAVSFLLAATLATAADDQALWREYGLVGTQTNKFEKLSVTTYQMKDLTGALAAWEWQRSAQARACTLADFCTQEGKRTVIAEDQYLVVLEGATPTKAQVDAILGKLSNRRETSLPAILTFLPRQGLAPNSAKYVLGRYSLDRFAPELAAAKPGFEEGAEAQVGAYRTKDSKSLAQLAIFYYANPEMARAHAIDFKLLPNVHVKRSGVLVAIVYGGASEQQADSLLSRIEYEAKITWNETPPPSPIKPLFQLLINIILLSIILSGLCLVAGLIYAAMRIYRRRYGTLEADEAMTTLHLTGD